MKKRLRIKNHQQELRLFQKRMIFTCIGVGVLIGLLFFRLFDLQVVEHNKYTTMSTQNHLELLPIAPTRGLIYSRDGILLAANKSVFSLEITPDDVKNLKQTITKLKQIIPISQDDTDSFWRLVRRRPQYQGIPLKYHLSKQDVAKLYVNMYRFPGVHIKAHLMRYYPEGKYFAHTVGYVSRINPRELARVNPTNYAATNFIGKTGLEQYYEKQLHGLVGYQEVEVDAQGRIVRTLERVAPVPGKNLYLSLDVGLQIAATKAMGKYNGAVVVIQPSTGQILAMVSTPNFDPNLFVDGISEKTYRKLADSKAEPLFNRDIRGQYPFGSTAKPIEALEALNDKVITPQYTIFDPGWFKLPNYHHIYHCWLRTGHGNVDLHRAIVVSCDTFFYNLAHMMGIAKIDTVFNKFHLGHTMHIDIDGELNGIVASPEWKQRVKDKPWYPGDTIISGIGQGSMLATPLQIANVTAELANRGTAYYPHLLVKTTSQDDKTTTMFKPTEEQSIIFPHWIWHFVIKAMVGVVTEPEGTGWRFGRGLQFSAAAKTGTAQVYSDTGTQVKGKKVIPIRLRSQSLLIAFAPVKHPKIAIAVLVEHSPHVAPEVAHKVVEYYMMHQHHLHDKSLAPPPLLPVDSTTPPPTPAKSSQQLITPFNND